jgi:hypothetical protein
LEIKIVGLIVMGNKKGIFGIKINQDNLSGKTSGIR